MNVLLEEEKMPCGLGGEKEEIDGRFAQVDVVTVLGANDVVNRGL
ncbi:NAD(P)(+) transhydrogenase (Re/Si-specific) subunit beta [Paraburkholderia sp. GAS32]|jgi:NAD/NADP transhydrogenase beta subunit